MFVIVTMAPGTNAPIHVYGGPWDSHHEAKREADRMDQADRQMYPERPRVSFLVRKVISSEPGPMVEVTP